MPPSDLAPRCDCPHCGTPWQTYASLFQHNPQPMWVFDRRTLRFLEVNRAAVARYGYSREEFLSRTLFDIRPQEDADLLVAELSKWEQLEGPYSCQWRHQLRDGLLVDVSVSADFVDWAGTPACLVTVLDLTPLRAAERQAEALSRDLEVERRRLRDVFESAPGFIAIVRGPDHVFEMANAAYRELVGMDPVGRPIREVVPELEAQGVFALLDHVYRTGEAVSGDEARVVLARADGRQDERFVRFVWEPLMDARGRIEGVLAHGIDMTPQVQARRELQRLARDQRNALRALRLSEERFALLSHNIPQVFWISGEAAQGVIYVSPHFESVFGMSSEALLSGAASITDVMEPDDVAAFRDASARQRRGESTATIYRIRHPSGGLRYIEDRGFPVRDEAGRVYRIAGVAKDITERREATEALELERTKLQTMLDNLPVLAAFFDASGALVLANGCLTKTLGWSDADGFDLDAIAAMPREPGERHRLKEFIASATGDWDEFDMVARDGSTVLTSWAYVKLPDGSTIAIGQDISELKRSEHELRLSEARFRLLVEGSAQVLFFVHDLDGRFEYVSPSSLAMFGYPPEELIGRSYAETLAPGDAGDVHRITLAALDTGLPQPTYQARALHRDGRTIVIEVTEEPITRHSRVVGMQGFARDITDRVAAEAALRESEERLHAIVNTVTEGLVIVSAAGNIEFANPAAERILGLRRADLTLRVYDDPAWKITTVTGEPLRQEDLPFVQVMRTNAPVHDVEHAIHHDDGRRVVLSINGAPMHDDAGRISGVVTSLHDVTERRRAQQELEALHGRLVAIVETSPLGIVMVDTVGTVQVWNRAAERIFGWSAAEVIGGASPVRSPDGSPVILSDMRSALLAGQMEGAEVQRLARDGRVLSLSMWTAPLRDAGAQLTGLLFVIADVSDRKQLEEQLRQAQKMEAVGRLAGGIAHDFNNVLTSILGHADLVLERVTDTSIELHDDLAEIRKGAERARALTQQLLAFSRRQIVQPRVLDAAAVVGDMWRMLLHLAGENIELTHEAQDDLWPLLIDRGQLEQLLLNLVVNARDAMPDGGVIRVRLYNTTLDETDLRSAPCPAPGAFVGIEVSDSGTGIEPAVLPYIFEPFFTTKELGKGTGLGLATVYGIIAQNGGCVSVESEPGAGAVFRLFLPRATQEAATPPEPQRSVAPDENGTGTILLVEDEPAVRALASRVLSRKGYTVLEAGNGEEALRIFEKRGGEIDLILTDMVMPGMSGRDLARRLLPRAPAIPVIFMSGYTEEILGGEDLMRDSTFLEKPFAPAALTAAVRSSLSSRRSLRNTQPA